MKKNGFTLAEVLITLAIIGVVATLTLPALMTNTAEQQAKTALKKGINTLTEAAQMNQAIDGFDYASLTSSATDSDEAQSLYALLSKRTNIDYLKSGKASDKGIVSYQGSSSSAVQTSNFVVFFRDGSALIFPSDITSSSAATSRGTGSADGDEVQKDGLPYGLAVLYDTNGTKGPNIVSNCQGNSLGVAQDSTSLEDPDDPDSLVTRVCTKDSRVIKDQFGIRLRGGFAVPNGAAARWAFAN